MQLLLTEKLGLLPFDNDKKFKELQRVINMPVYRKSKKAKQSKTKQNPVNLNIKSV